MIDLNLIFKKLLKSPIFSIYLVLFCLLTYFIISAVFIPNFGYFDIEKIGISEILTYLFYGFSAGIAFCKGKKYLNSKSRYDYFLIMFLWFCALLRECGIQHYLTVNDSVVTKIRFFTNPNNPLHEKIIAGTLMLIVVAVLVFMVIKYFKKVLLGILKKKNYCITVLTFVVLCIFTQFADRYPANYLKHAGTALPDNILFLLKIFEEGGESLLPLLFALGFCQKDNEKIKLNQLS